MRHIHISTLAACLLSLAACAGSESTGGNQNMSGGGVTSASYSPSGTGNDAYDMATEERRLDATDENERLQDFEHHAALREHRDFCESHSGDPSCDSRLSP